MLFLHLLEGAPMLLIHTLHGVMVVASELLEPPPQLSGGFPVLRFQCVQASSMAAYTALQD